MPLTGYTVICDRPAYRIVVTVLHGKSGGRDCGSIHSLTEGGHEGGINNHPCGLCPTIHFEFCVEVIVCLYPQ